MGGTTNVHQNSIHASPYTFTGSYTYSTIVWGCALCDRNDI